MTRFARLVRAELLGLLTLRATAVLAAGLAVCAAGLVALTVGLADRVALRAPNGTLAALSGGGFVAYAFAFVLGAAGMAGEYRHGTLEPALLAVPGRDRLLAAKAAALALAGAVAGLAGSGVGLAVAAPWLAARGVDVDAELAIRTLAGSALTGALFGALGVGAGALVRNQAVVVTVGVVWLVVVDTVVLTATSPVGRLLPGGAATSLLTAGREADVLPAVVGGLVLAGYTGLFLAAGAAGLRRWRP